MNVAMIPKKIGPFINRIQTEARAKTNNLAETAAKHKRAVELAFVTLFIILPYLVSSSLSLSLLALPLLAICYTNPERLAGMRRDKNLPDTIVTDITKPLAQNIAIPFGQKFKDLIESIAANSSDQRITKPVNLSSPEVNDTAIEDVLFDMLGKINSDPDALFEAASFGQEYEINLAKRMKSTYFATEPITVEQIRDLISGIKIDGRQNISQMIAEWIEDNAVFGGFGFGFGFGGGQEQSFGE